MKRHLNKILGLACLLLALHSANTLYASSAKYLFQWDGTIALAVVGAELILIRLFIHKDK